MLYVDRLYIAFTSELQNLKSFFQLQHPVNMVAHVIKTSMKITSLFLGTFHRCWAGSESYGVHAVKETANRLCGVLNAD